MALENQLSVFTTLPWILIVISPNVLLKAPRNLLWLAVTPTSPLQTGKKKKGCQTMLTPELREKPLFSYVSHWFTCVVKDSIQQSKKCSFTDRLYLIDCSLKVAYRSSFRSKTKFGKDTTSMCSWRVVWQMIYLRKNTFDDRYDHQQWIHIVNLSVSSFFKIKHTNI